MATLPQALPHFARSHVLGTLLLLGVEVRLFTADPKAPLNAPCLYEIALYGARHRLVGVYVGKARRGIGRPIEQYDEFVRSLRENRRRGLKLGDVTPSPFKPGQPWGFRWIHHELERTLLAIARGAQGRVEVCVLPLPFDSDDGSLNHAEAERVDMWKHVAPHACLNGGPAMSRASDDQLDRAWKR